MIDLVLYNYSGRRDVINKSLTAPTTLQGTLFGGCNILRPTIRIRTNSFAYNYVYIPSLNRYYFVEGISVVETGVYEIRLTIDVLMSYSQVILEASATINQKENSDSFISNRTKIYDRRPNFTKIQFTGNHFLVDGSIIMVTIRG